MKNRKKKPSRTGIKIKKYFFTGHFYLRHAQDIEFKWTPITECLLCTENEITFCAMWNHYFNSNEPLKDLRYQGSSMHYIKPVLTKHLHFLSHTNWFKNQGSQMTLSNVPERSMRIPWIIRSTSDANLLRVLALIYSYPQTLQAQMYFHNRKATIFDCDK